MRLRDRLVKLIVENFSFIHLRLSFCLYLDSDLLDNTSPIFAGLRRNFYKSLVVISQPDHFCNQKSRFERKILKVFFFKLS